MAAKAPANKDPPKNSQLKEQFLKVGESDSKKQALADLNSPLVKSTPTMSKSANELFLHLTAKRDLLSEYLSEKGDFTDLILQIKEIEYENKGCPTIFKKLLLSGNYPLKELPTKQLIEIFKILIKKFKINAVIEIDLSGVLTNMLEKSMNNEKTGKINFQFEPQLVLNQVPSIKSDGKTNSVGQKSMLIYNWTNSISSIQTVLSKNMFQVVILMGNFKNPHLQEICKKNKYKILTIHGKQLSITDYFLYDNLRHNSKMKQSPISKKDFLNLDSSSSRYGLTIIYNCDESLFTKDFSADLLSKPALRSNDTQEYVLQDLFVNGYIPKFANELKDNSKKDYIYNALSARYSKTLIYPAKIPAYIRDLEEFKFFEKALSTKQLPTKLQSPQDFHNYYTKYTTVEAKGFESFNPPDFVKTIKQFKQYINAYYSGLNCESLEKIIEADEIRGPIIEQLYAAIHVDFSKNQEKLILPP